jgi:hypothetical protein
MIAAAAYNPAQWNNFFLLVGTGSATLAGLVFLAVTINLKGIAEDARMAIFRRSDCAAAFMP